MTEPSDELTEARAKFYVDMAEELDRILHSHHNTEVGFLLISFEFHPRPDAPDFNYVSNTCVHNLAAVVDKMSVILGETICEENHGELH